MTPNVGNDHHGKLGRCDGSHDFPISYSPSSSGESNPPSASPSPRQKERDEFWQFLSKHVGADDKIHVKNYQEDGKEDHLHEIAVLDLSSCKLTVLPPEICLLQGLIKLELVNNQLKELPEQFSSLRNLKILHLAGNSFEHVPNVLSQMPWITQLYLYKNPLKGLPVFLNKNALKSYPPGLHWIPV